MSLFFLKGDKMLQATSNIIIMASAIKVCVYDTKAQKIVKNNNILYIGRIIELLIFLVSFQIHVQLYTCSCEAIQSGE